MESTQPAYETWFAECKKQLGATVMILHLNFNEECGCADISCVTLEGTEFLVMTDVPASDTIGSIRTKIARKLGFVGLRLANDGNFYSMEEFIHWYRDDWKWKCQCAPPLAPAERVSLVTSDGHFLPASANCVSVQKWLLTPEWLREEISRGASATGVVMYIGEDRPLSGAMLTRGIQGTILQIDGDQFRVRFPPPYGSILLPPEQFERVPNAVAAKSRDSSPDDSIIACVP